MDETILLIVTAVCFGGLALWRLLEKLTEEDASFSGGETSGGRWVEQPVLHYNKSTIDLIRLTDTSGSSRPG